jgi:hypothetical protein
MDPRAAAEVLIGSIQDPGKPLTVADAAAAGGLALRDADRGLHWLSSEYRGHLRVTESGELLFRFPHGFAKPWETRDRVSRMFTTIARGAMGVLRFVVRAWVMVVLVGYVALFVAVLIGLMFANQNDRNDRRGRLPGGDLALVFIRILGDALFWTFHPFSPFAVGYGGYGYGYAPRASMPPSRSPRAAKDETPFYEKVNRFFFGPTPPPSDPRETERKVLAELRAQKGRIGLADVMRVTGLPREQADPLMARLMLDYDGDVGVSEEGGIYYHFESMRKTGEAVAEGPRPRAAWDESKTLPPLTGNSGGSNALIFGLNAFNLIMSLVAIDMNLTLSKLPYLFGRIPLDMLPYAGTPIALGVVPLVFSIALLFLPAARALAMPFEAKALAKEKGRLAVLRAVLARIGQKAPITDKALVEAWKGATGEEPDSKEVTRRVVELGGDAEVQEDTGEVRYRFVDLETEAKALEEEREQASDEEKKVGKVVFASDN